MKELLQRLEKADPDTYQRAFVWLKNVAYILIQSDPEKYFLENGLYPLRDALLQVVLQDAIRARKWCYWIGKTELTTFAHIDRRGAASKGPDSIERRADNEPEALLLAYLAAAERA
jgi:hypothetical protein